MMMKSLIHNARPQLRGTIGLGVKVEGEKFPRMTDYFVVDHLPEIVRHYGKQPTALHIQFPVNDPGRVAPSGFKAWSGQRRDAKGNIVDGVLKCAGDGSYKDEFDVVIPGEAEWMDRNSLPPEDEIIGERNPETGKVRRTCYGTTCVDYKAGNCKRNMQMYVVLPLISRYYIYRIDTSARKSIESVVLRLNQTFMQGGDITQQVYEIYRKPTTVQRWNEKEKKMIKDLKPLMFMRELDTQDFMQLNGEAYSKAGLILGPKSLAKALPSPEEQKQSPSPDLYPTEPPAIEVVARTPGGDTPESLVDHPDLRLAFDEYGRLCLGHELSAKDRLILIKKKEGSPNLKEEVRITLLKRIEEKKAQLATQLKPPPQGEVKADLSDIT